MDSWDPGEYLRFSDERTRPSVDLVTRIAVERPATVIDLGCGPGSSTRVLRRRWPEARIIGLDSSPQMITAARAEEPNEAWILSGIEDWVPVTPLDVVFSNATLQWLPDHGRLIQRLFRSVSAGGALAFQIPSAKFAAVRILIHEIALEGPWAPRMSGPLGGLTMESPSLYYDCLAPQARSLDMWETEYFHVMDSAGAIVDWIASTGLRPFLEALESEDERQRFVILLRERVCDAYQQQKDGRVLFPFRRTFVIAYRP
jgi:trans-aconitate 2-methyltransferase